MNKKQKEKCYNRITNFILNQKGSTLITVLIAVAFIVILASIVLSSSIVNYRMKGIDRKTKTDFYSAEKALNDIYTGLGQDITKIAATEYSNALTKLNKTDGSGSSSTVISDANMADKEYRKSFYMALTVPDAATGHAFPFLMDNASTSAPYHPNKSMVEALASYIVVPAGWTVNVESHPAGTVATKAEVKPSSGSGPEKFIVEYTPVTGTSSATIMKPEDPDGLQYDPGVATPSAGAMTLPSGFGTYDPNYNCLRMENIKITSIDKSGYQSVISTDIMIATPSMDFFGNNTDISEFSLIANKGINFAGGNTSVQGNVYGGLESKSDVNGGLALAEGLSAPVKLNGDYIISRGNISVGNGSKLIIGDNADYQPNIWFESLMVKKASTGADSATSVAIGAGLGASGRVTSPNMFSLNDLQIDGDGSDVAIYGSYYGYNDGATGTGVAEFKGAESESKASVSGSFVNARSSAIIVNGNRCSLDMEDLDTFVLMGKAYIDFTNDPLSIVPDSTSKTEIATGEGVALKSNQQLYLLPAEFLTGAANPCEGDFNSSMLNIPEINQWFGYQYVKDPSSSTILTDTVTFVKKHSSDPSKDYKYTYVFLRFNGDAWRRLANNKFEKEVGSPGTNGLISSADAFRLQILEATAGDYADSSYPKEPTALTLRKRAQKTMTNSSFYNLKEAVVAKAGTNIYAQNTVVQFKPVPGAYGESDQTIVENNNSYGRMATYPTCMWRRYRNMCCYLNLNADKPLSDTSISDIGSPADWNDVGSITNNLPIDHVVFVSSLPTDNPSKVSVTSGSGDSSSDTDLPSDIYGRTVFGTVPAGSVYEVDADFKGVIIINGDVQIDSGVTVDGLVMATGKIIVADNATVTQNAGMLSKRISREIDLVKNSTATSPYKPYYLITYLRNASAPTQKMYEISATEEYQKAENRVEFDYNKFLYFENWDKGEE